MVKSWECNGLPKDGKLYPNQNPVGRHEIVENFGGDCVICGLPKEAVIGNSNKPPLTAIKAGVSGILTLAAVIGGYEIWQSPFCSPSEQKIDGVCVAIVHTTPPPPTPSPPTPSPSGSISTLASVTNVPTGIFRYGGSTTFAPLRDPAIVDQIRQAHPGYELVYTEPPSGSKPGSGIGIKMLIDGQLSFSQSSRPVKDDEYKAAKDRNFQLEQIPVAIDGIAIYVNRQVSISDLKVSQLKDIFTGKIKNWKEVGGSDLAITPISRDPKDGGTPEYFQETVLEKADFADSVQPYVRDTTSGIKKVATTPGGISYATASEVCDQSLVKVLSIGREFNQGFVAACNNKEVNKIDFAKDTYPITRRLFVVIKRDGRLDEQSGVAYANMLLTDEGQQIINKAGLVSLH
ncbi:MAG: phosphate ABC transporter substrate-binding protein [Stigonema ocellatum SAG 48.90 = DSM 106950]|nr:phosphate ABC transporter substrate-binding protein [Stigonema ocellatum SAG 48.90 = DSM 106950]